MPADNTFLISILTAIDCHSSKKHVASDYTSILPDYSLDEIEAEFHTLLNDGNEYVAFYKVSPITPAKLTEKGQQYLKKLREGNTFEDFLFPI